MKPQELFLDFDITWLEENYLSPWVLAYREANKYENNFSNWLDYISFMHEDANWSKPFKFFGGYLEDRSPLFDKRHNSKADIHLGVDFWVEAGTKVYLPFAGKVVYSGPKTQTKGGWGGRLDIQVDDKVYIFGHLDEPLWETGEELPSGIVLGTIANKQNNGGWLPHLHLQGCSTDFYNLYDNPRNIDGYSEKENEMIRFSFNPLD